METSMLTSSTSNGYIALPNANLANINSDFLYHLNINVANTQHTSDIQKKFGNVKFVLMGGTGKRMKELATYIGKEIMGIDVDVGLKDLCEGGHRYAMFKVGPVICASHGIGMSSFSILLHELLKLLAYAKAVDPVFIRIGTSGGLGVQPGTVVITQNAYNGYLRNEHEIAILGERVVRTAKFDESVLEEFQEIIKKYQTEDIFTTLIGNTIAAECFYEGQARIDGASCHYTEKQQQQFLHRCHDECGVRNFEMEATMFAALTRHVGVKAADICVTLLNRLNGDQITLTMEQKAQFEMRPFIVVGRYIKEKLHLEH